jgi:murein DD-endopeptidase MepM/ murein hydrolase activator NlpD
VQKKPKRCILKGCKEPALLAPFQGPSGVLVTHHEERNMLSVFQIAALLAASIAAQQGQAVRLSLPHEPGVQAVEFHWRETTIPYARVGAEWITVVGVDLETKPGAYTGEIRVTKDGTVEKREATLDVKAVDFPVDHLQVAEEFVQLSPENSERALREAKIIEDIHKTISGEALWREPFVVPIEGREGSNFGRRRVFNGESRNPHAGADLRAATGTPVRSANRGRVVLARNLFFTGNTVIVDHGLGVYTLYAHLSRIDAKEKTIVERAQVVGLAGATGRVTGPHLHWGSRVQNSRVDPYSLVNFGK